MDLEALKSREFERLLGHGKREQTNILKSSNTQGIARLRGGGGWVVLKVLT